MPEPARPDQPTVIILYGGTGDLAKRMVLPAFYELFLGDMLPKEFRLVGNGRGDVAHEDFRERVRESLAEFGSDLDLARFDEFAEHVLFAGGGFRRDDPGSLLEVIGEAEREVGEKPALIHYLAIPPDAFEPTTEAIAEHGLAENAKAVYEKPYGTSTDSFRKLDELVHQTFDEEQVYRIDHFLGKEATQNLHLVRFANRLFGDAWSADHLAQVQIDVPETLDIADRAEFYDATGAALDMLVTHLFQLAAEVAMEPPVSLSPTDLQAAREGVLAAFRPLDPDEVVLGQFDGYTDIEGVADDSQTDTFVAARLWVDTDRWHGVPFVLRTGKRMAASEQRVSLLLRRPEGPVRDTPGHGNVLSLSLSGSGAVDLQVVAKEPGPDLTLATATASLQLADVPGGTPLPPYVSLLHDVLVGDRSLFTSSEGLANAWRAFAPLQQRPPRVHRYAPGSWGPQEAEALAEPCGWLLGDGRRD